MQPQPKFSGSGPASGDQSGSIGGAQCGAPMPIEMRFCRSCGNRLGEGPAEYTETVRFPNATAAADARRTSPFMPGFGAPVVQQTGSGLPYKRRRRLGGMTWVFIAIAFFFASGGALSMLKKVGTRIPGVIRTLPVAER